MYYLWQLIWAFLQSDWLIASLYMIPDVEHLFQLLQEIVHFSSFHSSGIEDSQNLIKCLPCLLFGQTTCKH